MFGRIATSCALFLLGTVVFLHGGSEASAEDAVWHVSKSSGDVWLTAAGARQVSLSDDATLKPGDYVRTGRNGRVLLVRGEETILISPNSVIGLPVETREGLSTTIVEQAGSILLEVEKRNVRHFEVETPYLAAVVKGTQFRVSVNRNDASVDVLRGEVEVKDFKSSQFALVLPGQAAAVSAHGSGGLSLSGAGSLNPIQKGEPRPSSVMPVPVSREALSGTPNGQRMRIASPLGDVQLNFQKVTNGLARAATIPAAGGKAKETVWTSGLATPGNGGDYANGQGNGNGNSNGSASGSVNGSAASAVAIGEGLGQTKGNNGNGNGNNGNHGNGNNGNHGNGNNGNGNGH